MNRLGVFASYVGFICTAVGLAVGFYHLPSGDGEKIGFWLAWVPVGFVLLLAGLTTTQLMKK
jgi:hypothetical protein